MFQLFFKLKQIKTLCLFLFTSYFVFGATDDYRIMWRQDPATSMVIGWNQISGSNATVYYDTIDRGSNVGAYRFSKTVDRSNATRSMNNRFARLTNLQPNTAYYFVIADGNSTSQRFWFKTTPNNSSERLSFIAGGDSRNGRVTRQHANTLVKKLRPHAVFFTGDFTDDDTSAEWNNWFEDWQQTVGNDGRLIPIVATRGNHESNDQVLIDLFDLPNAPIYYRTIFGGGLLSLYTLNTEISMSGNQKTWLGNTLASDNSTFKMANYHKPVRPHTSPKSEGTNQYAHWIPFFDQYDMDLVVECDSHTAKSTWPIKASSGAGSDEGFIRDDQDGTVYVGEGCWGAPLRVADDAKNWTRDLGRFNQFKWIFVDQSKIEVRSVRIGDPANVGTVSDNNIFTPPANLNINNPANGSTIVINKNVQNCANNASINLSEYTRSEFFLNINNVNQLSGITALPNGNLMAIDDDNTKVIQFKPDGSIDDESSLGAGFQDTESIVYLGNNEFAIIEELKARIVFVTINIANMPATINYPGSTARIDVNIPAVDDNGVLNNRLEGAAYDPGTTTLYIAKQTGQKRIYSHVLGNQRSGTISPTSLDISNLTAAQFHGMHFASSGQLLVLGNFGGDDSANRIIYEIDPCGDIKSSKSINNNLSPTPGGTTVSTVRMEGITEDAKGNLYIVIDQNPGKLFKLTKNCAVPTTSSESSLTASSVRLNWGAVSGASSYRVEYKKNSDASWTTATTATTATNRTINNLSASTNYQWRVRTTCTNDVTSSYRTDSFQTQAGATCNAPTSSSESNLTDTSVRVNWGAVSGVSSYRVEYKKNTDASWSVATTATTATNRTISNLSASTNYQWRVRTTCTNGLVSTYRSDLFTTTGGGGSMTSCRRITSSGNDVEESANGFLYKNSSDLELIFDDYTADGTNPQGNQSLGLRFYTMNIPQGANITSAYIQFTSDDESTDLDSNPANVTIWGYDANTAPLFSNNGSVTGAPKTSASVNWNIPDWTYPGVVSNAQRTPDLSSIVQEIVNRSGFTPSSAIGMIISGQGRRNASSADNDRLPNSGPQLCVTYDTSPLVCNAPTSSSESNLSATSVRLNWGAVAGASNYRLEYKKNTDASWTVSTSGTTSTNRTINNLSASTNYQWRVRANCSNGLTSNYRNDSFTTSASPCAPPSNPTTTNIGEINARFTWTASANATSYRVEYKKVSASTWTVRASGTSATSVATSGLDSGTQYQWRVRSNCGGATSSYVTASFTTNQACSIPSNLNSTTSSNSATVSWNAAAGANTYRVEYRTTNVSNWTLATSGTSATSFTIPNLLTNRNYAWRVRSNCTGATSNFATASFTTQNVVTAPTCIPTNWNFMEIEAKWQSDAATYNAIVSAFPDNGTWEGYSLNVRWSGIPRRYVDVYYDNGGTELTNGLHSLRHRTRSRCNVGCSNNLSSLQNGTWTKQWEKVQYKSNPSRYDAVWFREEQGDCELDTECSCSNENTIMAGACQHEATDRLKEDHPLYDFTTNAPISTVTQYRYRIELQLNNVPVYEISLDRVDNGNGSITYENELEIVVPQGTRTVAQLDELFRLASLLEGNANYNLTPSTISKGGTPVAQQSVGDADGDGICDAADNCPTVSNSNQANNDNDYHGNVCDNCPALVNNDQLDTNNDGVGDACTTNTCTPVSTVFSQCEGFESGLGIFSQVSGDDIDWIRKSGRTSSSNTGPTTAEEGSWYMYIETSGSNSPSKDAKLRTSCIKIDQPTLSFKYHMYGSTMGTLRVNLINNSTNQTTTIFTRSGDQGNNWLSANIDLASYQGQDVILEFFGTTGSSFRSDIAIDNICFGGPVCNPPSGLNETSIASSTATLRWTGSSNATSYRVEYKRSNSGTWTLRAGGTSGTQVGLTGLTANSAYNWRVRSTCGGEVSDWVTANFTTLPINPCVPVGTAFGQCESFEANLGGFTQSTNDNINWTRKSGPTSSSQTGPTGAFDGTYYMYIESSSPNFGGKVASLESGCITLNDPGKTTLNFRYHMYGSTMGTLQVNVKVNGNSTTVFSKSGDQGNSWIEANVDLSSYLNQDISIEFKGTTGSSYRSDISIDKICFTGGGCTANPNTIDLQTYGSSEFFINTIVSQVSGVTGHDNGNVFVINDNAQRIIQYNSSGNVIGQSTLSGFQDTEAIAYMGNNEFAIVEETRSRVIFVTISATNMPGTISYPAASRYMTINVGGMEGIAYDRATTKMYVSKQNSKQIYEFTLGNNRTGTITPSAIDVSSISSPLVHGLEFLPNGNLLVLGSNAALTSGDKTLFEIDLCGNQKSKKDLNSLPATSGGVTVSAGKMDGIAIGTDGCIYGTIDLTPGKLYKLCTQGSGGGIADCSRNSGIETTCMYNESFDGGFGLWANSSGDNLNWLRRTNSTPSSRTGPSAPQHGSHFAYIESSSSGIGYPNKTAYLESPCYQIPASGNNGMYIAFHYHMYGSAMGTLSVEVTTDDVNWTSVWSESGDKGNQWLYKYIALNQYSGQTIRARFKAVTGNSWRSDMAIDFVRTGCINAARQVETREQPDGVVATDLKVFPNPVQDYLTVEYQSALSDQLDIQIINPMGQVIRKETYSKVGTTFQQEFNVSDLANGIYHLRIKEGDQMRSARFVVTK